jgi:hypothetical protein
LAWPTTRAAAVVIPTALVRARDSVIPFDARRPGDPLPAPDLREGIPVRASVRNLASRDR